MSHSKLKYKGTTKAKYYNFKEKGNFKRRCQQLKNGKFKSEPRNNNTFFVVYESSNEWVDGDVMIVCTSSSTDAWILESRTSYHMKFNLDWFDSFKQWNGTFDIDDDEIPNIKVMTLCRLRYIMVWSRSY